MGMAHIDPHLYLGQPLGHPYLNWIVHWGDWLFGTDHPTDHLTRPDHASALIAQKQALERTIEYAKNVRDFSKNAVKRGVSMVELATAMRAGHQSGNPLGAALGSMGSVG